MCSRLRAVSTACSKTLAPPKFTVAAPYMVTGSGRAASCSLCAPPALALWGLGTPHPGSPR